MNGQILKTSMGDTCSKHICSALISIYIDNRIEHIWHGAEPSNMPRFNFTYVSLPIHELSELRVELWTTRFPTTLEFLDDHLKLAMFPLFHMLQSMKQSVAMIKPPKIPELRDIINLLKPTGADRTIITGRLIRGKMVIDKSIFHLLDGTTIRVQYQSMLLSYWSICPVYKFPLKNRLEGKLWSDGEQNLIFYNATWTPLNPWHYPPEAFETL